MFKCLCALAPVRQATNQLAACLCGDGRRARARSQGLAACAGLHRGPLRASGGRGGRDRKHGRRRGRLCRVSGYDVRRPWHLIGCRRGAQGALAAGAWASLQCVVMQRAVRIGSESSICAERVAGVAQGAVAAGNARGAHSCLVSTGAGAAAGAGLLGGRELFRAYGLTADREVHALPPT